MNKIARDLSSGESRKVSAREWSRLTGGSANMVMPYSDRRNALAFIEALADKGAIGLPAWVKTRGKALKAISYCSGGGRVNGELFNAAFPGVSQKLGPLLDVEPLSFDDYLFETPSALLLASVSGIGVSWALAVKPKGALLTLLEPVPAQLADELAEAFCRIGVQLALAYDREVGALLISQAKSDPDMSVYASKMYQAGYMSGRATAILELAKAMQAHDEAGLIGAVLAPGASGKRLRV